MLEFIVLGKIPGTSLQFNFVQLLIIAVALAIVVVFINHVRHMQMHVRIPFITSRR